MCVCACAHVAPVSLLGLEKCVCVSVCGVLILMNEGAVDDSWEKGSIRVRGACVCVSALSVFMY